MTTGADPFNSLSRTDHPRPLLRSFPIAQETDRQLELVEALDGKLAMGSQSKPDSANRLSD
jgi:hypothetical protein